MVSASGVLVKEHPLARPGSCPPRESSDESLTHRLPASEISAPDPPMHKPALVDSQVDNREGHDDQDGTELPHDEGISGTLMDVVALIESRCDPAALG